MPHAKRPSLGAAHVALMDVDPRRLGESELVAQKLVATLGVSETRSPDTDQRATLDGADFVVVAFQIGGYEPCTVTDFGALKAFGLRQTIAGTLGSVASCVAFGLCRTYGRSAPI